MKADSEDKHSNGPDPSFTARNPASGEILAEYSHHSNRDKDQSLEKLNRARDWLRDQTNIRQRAYLLTVLARELDTRQEGLAALMTREMGKPIREARGEIAKCALVCRYYADQAENFLRPEIVPGGSGRDQIRFDSIGVVLAVMPWNFPFWQVFRFLAPNLALGNTALLKHAPNVPGCGEAIEQLLTDVWREGLPEAPGDSLPLVNLRWPVTRMEELVSDPRIAAVTLTGSTRAGRSLAELAGRHLKKCVLELGGSDPYLVLADADIPRAASLCLQSRFLNSGQSCIAAKRFLVHRQVANAIIERLSREVSQYVWGDPTRESTRVGPLARQDLAQTLRRQLERGLDAGDEVLWQSREREEGGAWFAPALVRNHSHHSPLFSEETFGPVAVVRVFADEEEAVNLANESPYGLGAALFTSRGENELLPLVKKLKAGNIFVNDFVKSDPRLPFGGQGQSGFGRELSRYGMLEFANIRTVSRAGGK